MSLRRWDEDFGEPAGPHCEDPEHVCAAWAAEALAAGTPLSDRVAMVTRGTRGEWTRWEMRRDGMGAWRVDAWHEIDPPEEDTWGDSDEMGECELCECATPAGRDVCDECAVNLAHDGALVSVDGGDE